MSVQLLALEFLSPRPPLPAGEKAFTTVTVHCSILDVGVSQVCLATLVSVDDWNKNERWVYSISKKQFVLCLLLSLPWVRGTDPGEPHRQTDRQIETDTQDRQAEGLFKEVQWKWAHSRAWIVLRCTTSLEPSQCYPPFLSQPPNCTHSSSPLFILTPPPTSASTASSLRLSYRSASQTAGQSGRPLSTQDQVQISLIASSQKVKGSHCGARLLPGQF